MYRNTEDIKNSKSVGVSQVSQLVVMILLINDCYVMSLVVIISRMNFVLYRNTPPPLEKESYIKNTKFISSPVSHRVFQFRKISSSSIVCVVIFFLWYQNNQFVYCSFNGNETSAMILVDSFSWFWIFVLHLNFPYSTISPRKGFKHSPKLPLSSYLVCVLDKHYIAFTKISLCSVPLWLNK